MAARGSRSVGFALTLLLGLALYGGGAYGLLKFDLWKAMGAPVSPPPTVILVAPGAFYLVLAVIGLFRRVGLRALGVFVGRCAFHLALVITTGAALVMALDMPTEKAIRLAVVDLPPLVILQMLSAVLSLAPLAAPRPRSRSAKPAPVSTARAGAHPARTVATGTTQAPPSTAGAATAPKPSRAGEAMPTPVAPPAAVTPPNATPPAAVAPAPPVMPQPTVTPPAPVAPPAATPPSAVTPPAPVTPSPSVIPSPAPAPAAPAAPANEGARHEAPAAPSATAPVSRPEASAAPAETRPAEVMVRVSFERVASQFPPDAFRLPLDRVAANLLEPGHLLVPHRLLAPQLAEGRARVPWSVVADQFPREALALSDTDMTARLPEGAVTLPLDEVIRQIPADAFALSSPIVDVRGIEDFPLPFQPHVPPAESAADRVGVPATEPAPEPEPGPPSPTARIPESSPAPEREAVSVPIETVAEPPSIVRDAGALRFSVPSSERRRRVEPGRVAALLKPLLSALEIHEQRVGRLTVLSVASADLQRDVVVDSAAALAPLLNDRRLPAPATQATVRGARGTVVLTPLGALGDDAPLLAIAVASSAPLAYLERIALRAAEGADGNGGRPHSANSYAADGADLRDAAIPPHVRTLGESFRAFGPVVPTVLQDRATSLVCYMFLAPGVVARPLAHYARDLREALRGSALGPLDSFVLRMGDDRLVVREVDAGRGAAALLVAGGGPVDRLGLARLELERAVTRLGAR